MAITIYDKNNKVVERFPRAKTAELSGGRWHVYEETVESLPNGKRKTTTKHVGSVTASPGSSARPN